jgi:hypothetical protein
MNKFVTVFIALTLILFVNTKSQSQDIQVIVHDTILYDTLGAEIVFDFEIINLTMMNQIVFELRTIENLPEGWMSGLCFGENCFAPHLDSIATTPDFFTPELGPLDTLRSSVHVFAWEQHGTGYVQIQIGTFQNPNNKITVDFVATTTQTDVNDPSQSVQKYSLQQNYPNPFNPATNISFNLAKSSFVTLKVFNLLGEEVASLINRNMNQGTHTVKFDARRFNSGVYLYKLEASGPDGEQFRSVKKMILTK